MKCYICLVALLFIGTVGGNSAESDTLSKLPLAGGEKLYLHTDKSKYLPGDTIWIRGYLLNSSFSHQEALSGFVYVELYGDKLVKRIKIKDSESGFSGYLSIPDTLSSGSYRLRAYTRWMLNFPADFIYQKRIVVKDEKERVMQVLSENDFDLQFLPEGGRYFSGIPARIAFKGIKSDGFHADISGTLYSKDGEKILSFASVHNGMGLIQLPNPDTSGYYVIASVNDGPPARFEFPLPESRGVSVLVSKRGGKVLAEFLSSGVDVGGMTLELSNGEEVLYSRVIENSSERFMFDPNLMPYGVNSFTVRDINGEILAERLFFNYRSRDINLHSNLNKESFSARDSVGITLLLRGDSRDTLSGNFSVSVAEVSSSGVKPADENIISYMELSGKVKGYIEDAGFYFYDITPEKERMMDLLMMTQGWRYYCQTTTYLHEKELSQSISGTLNGLFSKDVKNSILMVIAPQINFRQAYIMDSDNRFKIEGLDFRDSTSFIAGVSGRRGGQLYSLTLDREEFPSVQQIRERIVVKNRDGESVNRVEIKDDPSVEKRNLNEIYVKSDAKNRITPKYNPSIMISSFSRTQLKEREELSNFDQMTLMDYLVYAYPGLVIGDAGQIVKMEFKSSNDAVVTNSKDSTSGGPINESPSYSGRVLLSTRQTSMLGPQEPLLYVDNIQWNSTAQLDEIGMTVNDVENVAFLRGTSGAMYNTLNGVILITTRRGRGVSDKKGTNIDKVIPLGYQTNVRFYSPKYSTTSELSNSKPDERRTLYWNPCIKTGIGSGEAKFGFFTGDKRGEFGVQIEGLLNTGEPFVNYFKIIVN